MHRWHTTEPTQKMARMTDLILMRTNFCASAFTIPSRTCTTLGLKTLQGSECLTVSHPPNVPHAGPSIAASVSNCSVMVDRELEFLDVLPLCVLCSGQRSDIDSVLRQQRGVHGAVPPQCVVVAVSLELVSSCCFLDIYLPHRDTRKATPMCGRSAGLYGFTRWFVRGPKNQADR